MGTGNIGTGNTYTLATLTRAQGSECFAFAKLDASSIPLLKARA